LTEAKLLLASTQLGDYYDALSAMKEQELTVLAEAHAEDPSLVVHRFRASVEAINSRKGIEQKFYDSKRKDPRSSTPIDDIKSTIEFASHICGGHSCSVKGAEALDFRYIDREIFPARTTGDARSSRRSLDLLLANSHDHMPVFAELKIARDKPTYFAFIQVLMLAAELQSPSQRDRLKAHPGGEDLEWPTEGPFADLYIIAFDPPQTGKYRARSFDATKRISEQLVQEESFSQYIRRIAYLEASGDEGTLKFESRFAFGRGI
jgi:hypothetical protein